MPLSYEEIIAAARASYSREAPTLTILDPRATFLEGQDGNVCSQTGEDGLLAALFARIGVVHRWCFEVGAADGVHLSNTWALRQAGWQAVLIEADESLYRSLALRFAGKAILLRERIRPDTLDALLIAAEAPYDLDLGVIDVDGEDYQVFAGLKHFRPRVLLVEFNMAGDGPVGGWNVWQAGAESVEALARTKGYVPLARCGCNCLLLEESIPL